MVALFGFLGLFGFLLCLVITIINAIRKKKVKPFAIGTVVCFIVFVVCIAITPSTPQEEAVSDVQKTTETVIEEKIEVPEVEEVKTAETELIVEEDSKIVNDDVVNNFLKECSFDYGEIKEGNIRTKFFIHINKCYTELLNSNTNELIVTINGYHVDNIDEPEVLDAFKMVAQIINNNEYEEDLENVLAELANHNTDLYSGTVGDLQYKFFPFVELSKGISESRIEIRTTKYNVQ